MTTAAFNATPAAITGLEKDREQMRFELAETTRCADELRAGGRMIEHVKAMLALDDLEACICNYLLRLDDQVEAAYAQAGNDIVEGAYQFLGTDTEGRHQ